MKLTVASLGYFICLHSAPAAGACQHMPLTKIHMQEAQLTIRLMKQLRSIAQQMTRKSEAELWQLSSPSFQLASSCQDMSADGAAEACQPGRAPTTATGPVHHPASTAAPAEAAQGSVLAASAQPAHSGSPAASLQLQQAQLLRAGHLGQWSVL